MSKNIKKYYDPFSNKVLNEFNKKTLNDFCLFLTGEIGSGKTTATIKVINLFTKNGFKIKGIGTRKIKEEVYFYDLSLKSDFTKFLDNKSNSKNKIIASIGEKSIKINYELFEKLGLKCLRELNKSSNKNTLIVLDEIGIFEDKIEDYSTEIKKVLTAYPFVIGGIKKHKGNLIKETKIIINEKRKPKYLNNFLVSI